MAAVASVATRSKTKIYLIGYEESEIKGSKLPSNRQVLSLFFYYHRTLKKTIAESARSCIREASVFWDKARIPVRKEQHVVSQLEKLHNTWIKLKKNAGRTSSAQKDNETIFTDSLDDLFDMAHADALNMIKIQEDKDFLLAQREKGRRGTIGEVDVIQSGKEIRADERRKALEKRKTRAEQDRLAATSSAYYSSVDPNIELSEDDADDKEIVFAEATTSKKSRRKIKKQNLMTPDLVSTLDRTKLSDRAATFVVTATVKSLGHNIQDMNVSHSTLYRARKRFREEIATKLKAEFTSDLPLVVHWDGKLLPELTGKELVDHLPVLVSGTGVDQLLGVPKLLTGTGVAQASAVAKLLEDWNVTESVRAMCFDTTSTNTGRLNGACVLLEQQLGKDLLYLACRHHVYEIILKAVFEASVGYSTGPDVLLFKRFQRAWPGLNPLNFQIGIADAVVLSAMNDSKDDILDFVTSQLEDKQPRDDYREFLELIVIFLGGDPTGDLRFKVPGALHHARWMAKALYSLKMFMFEGQFKLASKERTGLRDFCVFVISLYAKAWFTAPHAASAPANDLRFLQNLVGYESVNSCLSKSAFSKFAAHLWYLSEELSGLAFFDSSVSLDCKREMTDAIQQRDGLVEPPKRHNLGITQQKEIANLTVADFVTKNTLKLFKSICISTDFLQCDPEEWNNREDYKHGLHIVHNLKVVNDNAERGVALITEYNSLITKNEDQKQFLLQVVADHRHRFPICRKSDLAEVR